MTTEFASISSVLNGEYAEGGKVRVRGWVYRSRSSGGMAFVIVRDRSGVLQCTVKKGVAGEKALEDAKKAFIESAVKVAGTIHKDDRAPGGWELRADEFELAHLGEAYPITKDQSTEFLLDVRHLWLRSQKMTSILKARHHVVRYLREFFDEQGFYEFSPPIITKSGCEGGSTLFDLDYFGDKAYLSQSAQLYNEALIGALEKVFVLAPSFRAEKSRTTKHLAEYWHLEEEAAHYDNEDNMRLQEEMVSFVCRKMADEQSGLLRNFDRKADELSVVEPPFHRMSYEEAVDKAGIEWGDDFGAKDEAALTNDLDKPVFVKNFPLKIKPFYMEAAPDGEHALNSDLLAPKGHGEIIGGSQRIWEYDKLVKRMNGEGLDLKDYEWYLDLRRYGSVPHSGFGLGVERLLKWVLDLEHIRDAIPFPRVINRAYP